MGLRRFVVALLLGAGVGLSLGQADAGSLCDKWLNGDETVLVLAPKRPETRAEVTAAAPLEGRPWRISWLKETGDRAYMEVSAVGDSLSECSIRSDFGNFALRMVPAAGGYLATANVQTPSDSVCDAHLVARPSSWQLTLTCPDQPPLLILGTQTSSAASDAHTLLYAMLAFLILRVLKGGLA
ncbi:hypothetical protein DIPPA_33889 [Diplonema papillatum]|nr:hypothetical protein DIPPA_33889 [Diplonema papillatum]